MEFRDCLHKTLRILDSVKDIFRNLSASNKVAYCILYYIVLYPVSAEHYPSAFADLRFSRRIEFYDLRIWGAV